MNQTKRRGFGAKENERMTGEQRLKSKKRQAELSSTSEFTRAVRKSDSSKDFPFKVTGHTAHDAARRTAEAHAEASQRKTKRNHR